MAAAVAARPREPAELGQPRVDPADFHRIVQNCNKEGMDFLRKGQYKQAFEQLKYAEAVLVANQQDQPTSLLATTCNNFGCYYKKVGKLHAALSYLRKALKIEVSLQTDDVTVAGTHLNICAILSKLEKHEKAVQHALCAMELISNRINAAGGSASQDDYSVLAIAYHNIAVERDFLHQWDEAADAFMQGHEIAKKCLGDQHPLTQTLGKSSEEALQKSRRSKGGRAVGGVQRPPGTGQAQQQQEHLPGLPDITSARGAPKDSQQQQQQSQNSMETMQMPAERQVPSEDAPTQPAHGSWRQSAQAAGPYPPSLERPPSLQAPPHRQSQHQLGTRSQEVATPRTTSIPSLPPLVGDANLPPMADASMQPSQWMPHPQIRDPPPLPDMTAALQEPLPQVPPPPIIAPPASPPPLVVGRTPRNQERLGRQVSAKATEEKPEAKGLPEEAFLAGKAPGGGRHGRPPPGPAARALRQAERERNARLAAAGGKQAATAEQQSQLLRRNAAVKIQNAWRQYLRYRQETKERRKREHIAATMIQARWRAFHVRKTKFDKFATTIQKHVRRWLVARTMVKKKAMVVLQAHFRAFMQRHRLEMYGEGAMVIQRVVRGIQGRQYARDHRVAVIKACITLQAGGRGMKARRRIRKLREIRRAKLARERAATRIQSVWRGTLSRRQACAKRVAQTRDVNLRKAATKIQAAIRCYLAIRKVAEMRAHRHAVTNAAATTIRKYWLRWWYRRRYEALRQEFLMHQDSIVTIQRYMRGFLVRLRLWRSALRKEEELWATKEIQRMWRGYIGRIKWEILYESMWSRQQAAEKLQRYIRGWLARTRVHRMRRRRARREFDRARRRFKAAQKIQALARGHLARRRVAAHRAKIVWAATTIQRITRGHQLRSRLVGQVQDRRATQMQAVARGFLVRRRRLRVLAMVIHIQRAWRQYHQQYSLEDRESRFKAWQKRRAERRAASAS